MKRLHACRRTRIIPCRTVRLRRDHLFLMDISRDQLVLTDTSRGHQVRTHILRHTIPSLRAARPGESDCRLNISQTVLLSR